MKGGSDDYRFDFTLQPVQIGVTQDGKPVTTCVVVRPETTKAVPLPDQALASSESPKANFRLEGLIYRILERHPGLPIRKIVQRLKCRVSRSTVHRRLRKMRNIWQDENGHYFIRKRAPKTEDNCSPAGQSPSQDFFPEGQLKLKL
jgi:hypothetical protein